MPTGLIQKYTMKSMEHYGNNDPNYVKESAALYGPYYDVGKYLRLVRNIFQHLIEYKDILPDSLEESFKKLVERFTRRDLQIFWKIHQQRTRTKRVPLCM
jgi:hypothetical protein